VHIVRHLGILPAAAIEAATVAIGPGSINPGPVLGCGSVVSSNRRKYSENRVFGPGSAGFRQEISRRISWLDAKFVTRRINGIFYDQRI